MTVAVSATVSSFIDLVVISMTGLPLKRTLGRSSLTQAQQYLGQWQELYLNHVVPIRWTVVYRGKCKLCRRVDRADAALGSVSPAFSLLPQWIRRMRRAATDCKLRRRAQLRLRYPNADPLISASGGRRRRTCYLAADRRLEPETVSRSFVRSARPPASVETCLDEYRTAPPSRAQQQGVRAWFRGRPVA